MKTGKTEEKRVSQSVSNDTEGQMGTVEGKIRAVVSLMGTPEVSEDGTTLRVNIQPFGDVHYVFNDWTRTNIELDTIPTPCIVYLLPAAGSFVLKNGQARDWPDVAIAFLDRAVIDENAVHDDSIVERMKRLVLAFVGAFNKSGLFEPIEGELRYQVPIDILDSVISGVIIQPRIKEVRGVRLCDVNIRR